MGCVPPIFSDILVEPNEVFYVDLNSPSVGATIVDTRGVVTIIDGSVPPGPPVFTSPSTATVAENSGGMAYQAVATDPNPNTTLNYSLAGTDAGRFSINAATGAVTFISAPDFEQPTDVGANNIYDVVVTASDGSLTASRSVAITVQNVNEAPTIALRAAATQPTGTVLTGSQLFSIGDPDGPSNVAYVRIVDPVVDGLAEWRLAGAIIVPNGGYDVPVSSLASLTYKVGSGANSFQAQAFDASGLASTVQNYSVSGTTANLAPIPVNDSYVTIKNTRLSISSNNGPLKNDVDPNLDPLTFRAWLPPQHGSVAFLSDGSFEYTPNDGFIGTDSIKYWISDGQLESINTGTISIYIRDLGASLTGTAADDYLFGGAGPDRFDPGSGNDTVIGGMGTDTAGYQAYRSGVALARNGDGSIQAIGNAIGSDKLVGIERIDLIDGDFVFDVTGSQSAVVYRLYQAALARTPDEAGFRYWANVADQYSISALALAREFRTSPEFAQRYGVNVSDYVYAFNMYKNVLGRDPDIGGINYWSGQLANGVVSRDQLLVEFSESPENKSLTMPNTEIGYWLL